MTDGLSNWSLHASCTGKPPIHPHGWAVQDVHILASRTPGGRCCSGLILVEYTGGDQEENQVPPKHSFAHCENQSFTRSLHQVTRHRHYFTLVIISMLGKVILLLRVARVLKVLLHTFLHLIFTIL